MTRMQASRPLTVFLFFVFLFSGCSSPTPTPGSVTPFHLAPYLTQTPEFIPTISPPATEPPRPTPTPQIYSIAAGDTLSKIAQQFGVSLEALQAANPSLQPAALTVGQTLVIPGLAGQNPAEVEFPAPVALELGPVRCFPEMDGLTCLTAVRNPNSETVENVKVAITLLDENGQALQSQEALLPLNLLPPGQSLPAAAHFQKITVHPAVAQLKSSLPVNQDDPRYLPTRLDNLLISLDWSGQVAQVTGQVKLPEGAKPVKVLWLAATAFDADGQMVGFRRWEWTGKLEAGQVQPFSLMVYSLGPEIKRVEVQVEARP